MSAELNTKQINKLTAPPSIRPPPVPPKLLSPSLTNVNSHPLKKNTTMKPHHSTSPLHKISHPLQPNNNNNKSHTFGTLLLGPLEAKQNDSSPHFQAANNKIMHKPTLSMQQRQILSNIVITILSSNKAKKRGIDDLLTSSRRTSLDAAIYSSDTPDHGSTDKFDKMEHDELRESDHSEHNECSKSGEQSSTSPEPDFVRSKDEIDVSNIEKADNKSSIHKAKVVSSEKEKIILMNSILKYIASESEMDTIHRACFNLWKDWYRCYGTIYTQIHTAFMAVCEKLLGNVDSRALSRKSPVAMATAHNNDIQQITYHLSTQILTLKNAFAHEQLHSSTKKNGAKDAQNVSQIIDGMEPNVWLVVKHIILKYFSSTYWVSCKHTLFNLFLQQYENVHRKLDREFISGSCFGVYTLICQLCDAINLNNETDYKSLQHTNSNQNKLALDDGFKLEDSETMLAKDIDNDSSSSHEQEQEHQEQEHQEQEHRHQAFTNNELLQTLDWYYSVRRLNNLLNNKHTDYLTHQSYMLYKPVIHPLFIHFEQPSSNISTLIQSILDESDYAALKSKHIQLKDAPKTAHVSSPKKEKQPNFANLLSRIIDSCIHWICRDLYPNYRCSEFCISLTQLLAEPALFKLKKEYSRSMRIKRLHSRFNLPSDQSLLNDFSCALDINGKGWLHHGRLYFFKHYLCFYSAVLGIKDTQQKFLLPVTEIKAITKKITAFFFHNAIEVQMKDGRNFVFRSLIKRDVTFQLLQKLIDGGIDWEAVEKQQKAKLDKEMEEEHAREEERKNKIKEEERERAERAQRSQSTNAVKKSRTGTGLMTEISGFGMSTLKTALSAIEGSSSKLLSTDAKLLLQSKTKRAASKVKSNKTAAVVPAKATVTSQEKNSVVSEVANIEMKNMIKANETVYSTKLSLKNGVSRSAPTTPTYSKSKNKEKETGKASSDSETVHDIIQPYDDESSVDSCENMEEDTSVQDLMSTQMEHSPDLMDESGSGSSSNVREESREELAAKCAKLNSMSCSWVYEEKAKVEKDFEVMHEFEFGGIGLDEFWDKFWSNNAIFSPMDWIKANASNSNIRCTEWVADKSSNICGDQWYVRNVSCVTQLEPSYLLPRVTQCDSDTIFRFCKLSPHFYVVHKILTVNGVPMADVYKAHQKIQFTQNAKIDMEKPGKIALSTHMKVYFGVEWTKSSWLKSPIRSRTLSSVQADCVKYCEHINQRILQLHADVVEEEEKETVLAEFKAKKSKKKLKKKTKIKAVVADAKMNETDKVKVNVLRDIDADEDYDFVFKIGNKNALIRCRLLLSCFARSGNRWSSLVIVLLVLLAMFIILFCLYAFGTVIALISSVLTVLTMYTQQIAQMNQNQFQFMNYNVPMTPYGNPMEHIHKYENIDCNDTNDDKCIHSQYLHSKHCNELLDLISSNPTTDILHKTYNTLNCAKFD